MLMDCLRRVGVQKPDEFVSAWVEAGEDGDWGDSFDWGSGSDVPIVAECDLENPEECESCQ